MSDLAKKARAAMKSKAERLGASRPMEKVSSADWSPPELLNADVKTGMRPVSRRAFKKGGKVTGEACAPRADRKPRKAGGKAEYKAEATEFANAKVNRNAKAANEEREGIKHVGALKSGGRAKKATGGDAIGEYLDKNPAPARAPEKRVPLPPPRPKDLDKPKVPEKFMSPYDHTTHGAKRGGKIKKAEGGPLKFHGDPVIPGMKKGGKAHKDEAMDKALIKKMVKPEARKGKAIGGVLGQALSPALMLANAVRGDDDGKKRGGAAKHPDEAMDKALIKKMVKPEARKGKANGGLNLSPFGEKQQRLAQLKKQMLAANPKTTDKGTWGDMQAERSRLEADIAEGSKGMKGMGRAARKEGGGVFSGSGYPNKVPGVTGGRIARATGGKTKKGKAKTNINIVIAAGKPAGGADMMPPPSGIPTDNRGAGGLPVPVPPPQGAPAGMPMPMPVAMPMPMHGGAGAPAGAPPMPRKRGGRANGGQAPAQTSAQPSAEQPQAPKPRYPTDAEVKAIMDRSVANIAREMGLMPAAKRNSGGRISKIASSYKDMQAGAGSGEGRLQKTDIAKKGKGAPTYKTGGKVYRSYKDMDAGAGSGRGRLEKTEIAARKH